MTALSALKSAGVVDCPFCSAECGAQLSYCPTCGRVLPGGIKPRVLDWKRITAPFKDMARNTDFGPNMRAILRVASFDRLMTVDFKRAVILGRQPDDPSAQALNLSSYGAYDLGVSRQHCMLRRDENRLIVTDLGSANGTRLDGRRLEPHTNYVVAHGVQLHLSGLRMTICFARDDDATLPGVECEFNTLILNDDDTMPD